MPTIELARLHSEQLGPSSHAWRGKNKSAHIIISCTFVKSGGTNYSYLTNFYHDDWFHPPSLIGLHPCFCCLKGTTLLMAVISMMRRFLAAKLEWTWCGRPNNPTIFVRPTLKKVHYSVFPTASTLVNTNMVDWCASMYKKRYHRVLNHLHIETTIIILIILIIHYNG